MTGRRGFSKKTVEDKIRRDPAYAARLRNIINEDIGSALRDARHSAGVSQKIVAERMGVSESRVTQIESEAGAAITLRTLRRFASAVDCRLDIELVNTTRNEPVAKVIVTDDLVQEETSTVAAQKRTKVVTSADLVVTLHIGHIGKAPSPRSTSKVKVIAADRTWSEGWAPRQVQERYVRSSV